MFTNNRIQSAAKVAGNMLKRKRLIVTFEAAAQAFVVHSEQIPTFALSNSNALMMDLVVL